MALNGSKEERKKLDWSKPSSSTSESTAPDSIFERYDGVLAEKKGEIHTPQNNQSTWKNVSERWEIEKEKVWAALTSSSILEQFDNLLLARYFGSPLLLFFFFFW